ncbi:uncharacterized protein LOC122258713 isoform X1 [Penaeus japonicus]|uniref:uncharacterized protein LOC122258713 isoform X1 n=1 Tax=Penaeus japonicus TaxID=27405 RepID=UPI001C715EE8|nr:uncharacterized protein LOC122258713 isoform X1 [Penaeus japonicus]
MRIMHLGPLSSIFLDRVLSSKRPVVCSKVSVFIPFDLKVINMSAKISTCLILLAVIPSLLSQVPWQRPGMPLYQQQMSKSERKGAGDAVTPFPFQVQQFPIDETDYVIAQLPEVLDCVGLCEKKNFRGECEVDTTCLFTSGALAR